MKRRPFVIALLFAVWAGGVGIGAVKLLRYEGTAAALGAPTVHWPGGTQLIPGANEATLVMAVHPHCPCSIATMDELAVFAAHTQGRVRMYVLMVCPPGATAAWAKTSLWNSAAAIPGVTLIADMQGREAKRFGVATSGETLLYGPDLRLLFSGGITESRGHSGDNAGEAAIETLVRDPERFDAQTMHTPVYGCALFSDEDSNAQLPGGQAQDTAAGPGKQSAGGAAWQQ